MKKALAFYTGVLDFKKKYPEESDAEWVIDLVQGDAEIQLSQHKGDGAFGCVINICVNDVDGLLRKYVERGLDTTGYENSPVQRGPVDQTWGMREFYVTDADGNTLRFGEYVPWHSPATDFPRPAALIFDLCF